LSPEDDDEHMPPWPPPCILTDSVIAMLQI
jgi:hypothetical protein